MKKLAFFAFAAALSGSAAAAPEVYVIDTEHTFPRFEYNHLGYSTQLSRFDKTTGRIVFDKQAKTGSVDVTIDMKSVNTGSALFNEHIQAAEFLDTAAFPTATFRSTRVHFEGDRPARIDGNLTLKGITKPVTLTVTSFQNSMHPLAKKDAIGANATTKIKRSDFKADKYAPYVSDELTLTIAMEALKQ